MKRIVIAAASNRAIMWGVKCGIAVLEKLGRVLSHLRFRALIRNSGEGSFCHWGAKIKQPENVHSGKRVSIAPNVCLGRAEPDMDW